MARDAPHLLRPDHVAALQSSAGNKTVQGLFGIGKKKKPKGPGALTFDKTQWASTRYLSASDEGAGGVLFAGVRGREVVIKPGETMGVEGGIASYLVSQAIAAGRTGVALAPGYRLASAAEIRQMEQAFNGLVAAAGKEDSVKAKIAKLSKGDVVVQDMAQGKSLSKAIDELPKHTKKRRFGGGRKLRSNSPLSVFTDPRKIRALGAAHASDLFAGNDDRLVGWQPENLFVSRRGVELIDHVMDLDQAYLRSFLPKGAKTKKSADDAFEAWKKSRAQQLAARQFQEIAEETYKTVLRELPQMVSRDIFVNRRTQHVGRDVDKDAIEQLIKENQDAFKAEFVAGLQLGHAQLIRSLNKLLQIEGMLEEIAGGGDVTEVRRSLQMRRDFLVNGP